MSVYPFFLYVYFTDDLQLNMQPVKEIEGLFSRFLELYFPFESIIIFNYLTNYYFGSPSTVKFLYRQIPLLRYRRNFNSEVF